MLQKPSGTSLRVLSAALCVLACGRLFAAEEPESSEAERRLDFMKASVADYDFRISPEFEHKLTVAPEPLLRFTNPVSGLKDGGFFVWTDEHGRPMAGAQVFLTSENLWLHEFQSLSPGAFRGTKDGAVAWAPARAGVEPRPVPDAETPAATPVQRLAQMRKLAGRFSVSDEFEGRKQTDELRLLSKPLLRFGDPESTTVDGALFAQAHGTDPELLIILEALKTADGVRWYYSLAPMTGYALQARLDDKPVWEVEWRKGPYDVKDPFFILVHSQAVPDP
jgi:hypothetical protein